MSASTLKKKHLLYSIHVWRNQRELFGLKPIDITPVFTASGRREANVYLVDFFFQNDIEDAPIEEWPPTKRVIDGDITGVDVLIGMDIIGCGDFAVTNYEGRTCVSFRVPSRQKIDFGRWT